MCPLCYIPWLITLLGFFGLSGAYYWIDAHPILSLLLTISASVLIFYGGFKLWKYYRRIK